MKEKYDRRDCFVCLTQQKPTNGKCWRDGVAYEISCQICPQVGRRAVYFGESGYNSYFRGGFHLRALAAGKEDSPLCAHNTEAHPQQKMTYKDWKMEITGNYSRAILRQSKEGISISGAIKERDRGARIQILNSKKEFIQPGTIAPKFGQLFAK